MVSDFLEDLYAFFNIISSQDVLLGLNMWKNRHEFHFSIYINKNQQITMNFE